MCLGGQPGCRCCAIAVARRHGHRRWALTLPSWLCLRPSPPFGLLRGRPVVCRLLATSRADASASPRVGPGAPSCRRYSGIRCRGVRGAARDQGLGRRGRSSIRPDIVTSCPCCGDAVVLVARPPWPSCGPEKSMLVIRALSTPIFRPGLPGEPCVNSLADLKETPRNGVALRCGAAPTKMFGRANCGRSPLYC